MSDALRWSIVPGKLIILTFTARCLPGLIPNLSSDSRCRVSTRLLMLPSGTSCRGTHSAWYEFQLNPSTWSELDVLPAAYAASYCRLRTYDFKPTKWIFERFVHKEAEIFVCTNICGSVINSLLSNSTSLIYLFFLLFCSNRGINLRRHSLQCLR